MHRVVALLAMLTACSAAPALPDAASSAWASGPAMPRPALEPGVTLFGQKVVVAGGFEQAPGEAPRISSRVDAYDIADKIWRTLPAAPAAWTSGNLATVGATLYLAGGFDDAGAAHAETYQLDPLAGGWLPLAAMDPEDARGGAGVAVGPGHIYLLGGASASMEPRSHSGALPRPAEPGSSKVLASCVEYDLAADLWIDLPPLPVARTRPAAMRRADGSLIVAGGFASLDQTQPLDDVWVLPPPGAEPRLWQPGKPMRAPAGGCAYGVVLGQLVCAGGQAGAAARPSVDSYDPYTDEWFPREDMPMPRSGSPGAAAGGRLFIPGGAGPTGAPSDDLLIFSPLATTP